MLLQCADNENVIKAFLVKIQSRKIDQFMACRKACDDIAVGFPSLLQSKYIRCNK